MCRSDGGGGDIVYRWRWTVQEWRWTVQEVEVEVDCPGVVDIMVLGGVFVVDVVEGVELVVGCCEASPVVCKWKGIFFLSF